MIFKSIIFSTLLASAFPISGYAQFWHALPSVAQEKAVEASFSQDEKNVYYLSKESGIGNIWKVPVKGGAPVQVTKFTDHQVVRFLHLVNRPEIVYMRATDDAGHDYHIYRSADDGSGSPLDLTPAPAGVTAEIVGASYDGRYIYFTSNKVSHDKFDVYRYDTKQYINEVIFPNDKDYRPLAWSRDHDRLLMEDPETGELSMFDINTTERTPLIKPTSGDFTRAIMDPTNHQFIVVDKLGDASSSKVEDLSTKTWKPVSEMNSELWKNIADGNAASIDFSPNGKYLVVENSNTWSVREIPSGSELPLPVGAQPVAISPKETMIVLATPSPDGTSKLSLFDIGKKSSVDLTTVK